MDFIVHVSVGNLLFSARKSRQLGSPVEFAGEQKTASVVVGCHPKQINLPHLTPSHEAGTLICLLQRDGRLS